MEQEKRNELQVLLTSIDQIKMSLSQELIPQKVILLMGQTKAGKTTLFHYLHGKKLIWEKSSTDVWQLRPQVNFRNAYIGNQYESQTVYPNFSLIEKEDSVMIIDMPGFDDSRNEFRLLNIYIILQVIKLLKKVHICQVIPQYFCQGNTLANEFQKICNVFNKNIVHNPKYLSFIITKVENSDIKEYFDSQIDDLLESRYVQQLSKELKVFKTKNLYQFDNKEPIIKQGIQLKQRIQKQNAFFDTNNQPSLILSQNYAEEIIGKVNLQEFTDYLIKAINNIKIVLQPLLRLYTNIILIQLQNIIIPTMKYSPENFISEMLQKIQKDSIKIGLYELLTLKISLKIRKQIKQKDAILFLKSFKELSLRRQDRYCLVEILQYFGSIICLIKDTQPQLDTEYLHIIEKCLKQLASLITIIMQVNLKQVKQKIQIVTTDQNLFIILQDYYNFWTVNHQKILNSRQLQSFLNNQQVILELRQRKIQIQIGDSPIIQKIIKYDKIRNLKQINAKISKHKYKVKSKQVIQKIDLLTASSNQYDIWMNKLKISYQSLQILKKALQSIKFIQDRSIWAMKKILNKISQIFYCFSFFEEAIMFKLCVVDEIGLLKLIEEGMNYQWISIQFTRSILIPYYCKINVDMKKVNICFDYICHRTYSYQQLLKIQMQRIEALEYSLKNPQNFYLLQDRYTILEFYYINPILQNFKYYQEVIKQKQQTFNRSQITEFTGFINKIMKQ